MSDYDPVAAAIAAAQQQAAATPAPTTTAAQGSAVAMAPTTAVGAPGAPLSMDNLMMGSMSVDGWLKPKEYGLGVGDNPGLVSVAEVYLDMTEGMGFIPKMAIKGGNPAQYAYTTDNVIAIGGGSWADAQSRIRALDPKASPYRAVDLPFTVAEDIFVTPPGAPAGTAGTLAAKAGQRLGYTTSTTNWANWEAFYRECVAGGLIGKKVQLKIGSQRRTNKNNNVWGVMTFQLVGEVVQEETE